MIGSELRVHLRRVLEVSFSLPLQWGYHHEAGEGEVLAVRDVSRERSQVCTGHTATGGVAVETQLEQDR